MLRIFVCIGKDLDLILILRLFNMRYMLIINVIKCSLLFGYCICWLVDLVSKGNIGDLLWM